MAESQRQSELLSIVIPVYNVKDYLKPCLDSVLAQTYPNFEVILVDDGSTDGSEEICKNYAQWDNRIRLISQHNQGVVTARKNGIEAARGTYLGFVDADDYIDADLYQKLMDCRGNFDLVVSQWLREEEGEVRRCCDRLALGAYDTKEDMNFIFAHLTDVSGIGGKTHIKPGLSAYMMTKLYKSNLAKTVAAALNPNLTIGEDREFTYRYVLLCHSVLLTDICGYHYRIRKGSVSHAAKYQCEYLENACRLYETLLPVFQNHPSSSILLPQLYFKIADLIAKSPVKMGFPLEAQNKTFVFPYINQLEGKRIALYGGGFLGRVYRQQITRYQMCEIDLWVDPNWREYQREGTETLPLEELHSGSFDFVVLCVFGADEASRITAQLAASGLNRDKILWKEPLIF